MRVAVLDGTSAKYILDHTQGNTNVLDGREEAIFVGGVLTEVQTDKVVINTSQGAKALRLSEEGTQAFTSMLEMKDGERPTEFLYGLFNGEKFSQLLEFDCSTFLLTHDVGPEVGFMLGMGMPVPGDEAFLAVQRLGELQKFLKEINYHGEVCMGLTPDFSFTSVLMGHVVGAFSLYGEICQTGVQGMLDYMGGTSEMCLLYPDIVLANTVYRTMNSGTVGRTINAQTLAEKHLWRRYNQLGETVVVTSHGQFFDQAKRRLWSTLNNLRKYTKDLCYRTDIGQQTRLGLTRG